jgi:predicted signal transduction protein with EAL and GGDEF domain
LKSSFRVPPEEKLSYLQKPFHPHEIRQMTISLASKWRAEHRIVKLAYFDALTGLPNREQSRSRLNSALEAAKVNQRKIDRSFITSLVDCSDDRAIAAAIIAMSRSLRISVTAEGVESFPQLLFLQEHDCHEAQGFLFSGALPAAAAHKLLRRAAETGGGSRTQRLRHLLG